MSQLLDLKSELLTLKQNNRKLFSIDKLIRYCDIQENASLDDHTSEQHKQIYEHEMALWHAEAIADREAVRTVNESAFHALKTLVLVAGGSGAALLAFLGSVWEKASAPMRSNLADGLAYFGASLMCGALAYGLTYLTLLFFFELKWMKRGSCMRFTVFTLVTVSYIFIGLGLYSCYKAMTI